MLSPSAQSISIQFLERIRTIPIAFGLVQARPFVEFAKPHLIRVLTKPRNWHPREVLSPHIDTVNALDMVGHLGADQDVSGVTALIMCPPIRMTS